MEPDFFIPINVSATKATEMLESLTQTLRKEGLIFDDLVEDSTPFLTAYLDFEADCRNFWEAIKDFCWYNFWLRLRFKRNYRAATAGFIAKKLAETEIELINHHRKSKDIGYYPNPSVIRFLEGKKAAYHETLRILCVNGVLMIR